ncbi:preprotein translocase subunit YidC [Corynebacterium sphenisci DSM 44792]|uniref:Membrane protein insertase YidC n=1 Tax=Corynebacterium sphenisci DSM 44792 TaxID=1437874 RepID=A0A1L7D0A3_9CORY|nr:membrane protein insertase YidC [Corynebacterium sphenisci]APT91575.1 preprotein translocase subunit YidC [Corynebacterium sphenisci DSM 44792]
MLNFVYWPISAIMWFWHQAVSLVMEPSSGLSWVLSIVLLVVTIRALLFRPMFKSQRSMLKMQKLQPMMQEIKKKHPNDQQAQAMEMRKLQKEMGVNPLGGCLPMLVQIPVFIGLFHVLRSFNRTGDGAAQLGLSVEQNWNLGNYIFGVDDVRSFLLARVINAPLSASIGMPQDQYAAFTAPGTTADFTRMDIIMVALPLMVISALATHFNGRMTVNRTRRRQMEGLQKQAEGMMGQQAEMMNKMMMWFFPAMILFTGAIWHIGLLVYMLTNNIWTYFQQRYTFARLDQEERDEIEAEKAAKRAAQERLAPKPGAKPVNPKKGGKAPKKAPSGVATLEDGVADKAEPAAEQSGEAPSAPAKPQPGQRPANAKRKKKRKR